ncbi:SUF system NifU family Fe-S cluster assembly protein [Pediococcus inopinatus]|uniref:SUF system NifU family Fe-S cluster assembly protein n=1 Tax=Pediococcus inopinatus TaxID=114090 RepID=A0ABZ0Q5U8_9LACO|nr:SUF system NifU family Fe-S cluster assembly protein [Pediococcus inopinatus]AVK99318.1 SUF system NifU family Fe-S cluster assembly protein [Pediococcus inopinatus]KRN62202.1 NifU family SUF system FeS assembly protein [Pediococcus inopinatus]WPC18251.1 SUF system NifU family Fe-S cluster assembly protein [Pediococcus inopinatus]WPC20360.1 SUF system NifU family Fe-S cluster assembly protein [Pediococcus inopinatus]WPC22064.1 SUF system NifU family Fe-S cluster assembly protein [Pediococcu
MSLNKLNQLYLAVVMDHADHPHHKHELGDATQSVELHNVSCGDDIRVFIKTKANRVAKISFTGNGCTISQASASMMTDALTNLEISEAIKSCDAFFQLAMGNSISNEAKKVLGDAEILGSLAEFPARIKCATLAWHAAKEALKGEAK